VTPVLRELFRPWRQVSTWWALVHLALDVFVGIATFVPAVVLLSLSVGLLITFPLALPFVWLLFLTARVVSYVERSRHAALLDVELEDPVPPLQGRTWWRRLVERVRSGPRWREVGYALLRLPLGMLTTLLVAASWPASVALIGLPLYVSGLPEDTAKFGLFEVGPGAGAFLVSAVGVLGLALVAPWLTVALAQLDIAAARLLLSRSRTDELGELGERVSELETSRRAVVGSAEAERRRIERDLHDGAQQRLVSLAMNLGAAKERLGDDPQRAHQLVVEAHDEAKAALKDLRDLVRGIHPVILEDRGLDAALSAVVARSPVPVGLQVDVQPRPSPVVESTAYFVVTEALTNVARHAQATEAHVAIVRSGDRLVIEVRDDGVGGADPERGTGLAGLRGRVAALDGTMDVISPPGGPTTLLVEVPCGS
jgi:signal transduction histidine kinase